MSKPISRDSDFSSTSGEIAHIAHVISEDVLARKLDELYDGSSVDRIVSGCQITGFSRHPKSLDTWNSVVREGKKQGKLLRLVSLALRDYSGDTYLLQAQDDLLNSSMQTGSQTDWDIKRKRWRITLLIILAAGILGLGGTLLFLNSGNNNTIHLQYDSHRDPLVYYINLSDQPFENYKVASVLENSRYLYFDSFLKYKRFPHRASEELLVVAMTDPPSYARWLRTSDVVYREVIGVKREDATAFASLVKQISQSTTPRDRMNLLSTVLDIEFRLDGQVLSLNDFRIEPFGYVLVYKNPYYLHPNSQGVLYEFRCKGFQPRDIKNFPIAIPELTKHLDMKIDYRNLDVDKEAFFSAFMYHSGTSILIDHDKENHVLTVKSKENEWVAPGGGILFYWEYPPNKSKK